jgi:hypothetical protein
LGRITPELVRAQMSAAVLTIAAGAALWVIGIPGARAPMEHTLAIGALCALAALGAQAGLRKAPVMAQRIAAVLLSITVVCMVISPYVT